MTTRRFVLAWLAIAPLTGLAPKFANADSGRRRDRGDKAHGVHQDEVLQALKRNEIRPLAEIVAAAEKVMPGPVIGVKVKRESGRLVYELKIIAPEGRIREVYVDAATLDIVKIE